MKEAGNVHDVDTLLSDMSHHEKTILVDLDKLGNITTDREWRENAAKVCSATCVRIVGKSVHSALYVMV